MILCQDETSIFLCVIMFAAGAVRMMLNHAYQFLKGVSNVYLRVRRSF